ncbi:MAG: helix-turn-helix domain-containing protein [Anaerolineales bacterium]|nr:helix-turn-helix domain-containing protein [Anaerolineales bacterium]
MVSLTVQQKDLLNQLLTASQPLAIAQLAQQTHLSSRQVNYRLKPVKTWLAQHDATLTATPGIGVEVTCSPIQRQHLLQELNTSTNFQLILTAGQRQQLFGLHLLAASEPLILNWLQYNAAISRTTIFKDLEVLEPWLQSFGLSLLRKPNYGIECRGSELQRRQGLTALLWGDIPFDEPLFEMWHGTGLTFSLADTPTLPIIQQTNKLLRQWDTQAAFGWVAHAEAQLGGRFTDDAVLHLALALAIQAERAGHGHYLEAKPDLLTWLQAQKVWSVAADVAGRIWPQLSPALLSPEIAGIAMYLLAGLRDQSWPGELEIDPIFTELIDLLMAEVAQAFATPQLRYDTPLRDGLVAHVIPAFMRQRFGLWSPPTWTDGSLSHQYQREYHIAQELALLITERRGVVLPAGEVATLALLLRAAFVRESASRPHRVFIICPSGMATAQLLVARLKARFPSLEIMGVLSLRQLSAEQVADAQMLISTVPVQPPRPGLPVIQVHPLLTPEDIETITNWLT